MSPRKTRSRSRPLRRGLIALAAVGALALIGAGTLLWWSRELPAFGTMQDYRPLLGTRVYGADGSEVFQFASERRTVVPFDQIPDVMKKAVLASEDAAFYEHEGVNYLAIARCAGRALLRGRATCGGSTITQQVVKTFLLSPERSISRKVKEVMLARRLEQNLSKDEILHLYLNQINFGHARYGVEEAARFYFGKGIKDVRLGEAAMLAGVVQLPAKLSPLKSPKAAKERQKYVLRRMAIEGFITEQVAQAEMERPIVVKRPPDDPPGAWYADAVRRHLEESDAVKRHLADVERTLDTAGLVVEVAMHPAMQKAAEDAVEAQLRAVDKRQGWRGAPHHLDAAGLEAALPLWRERLQAAPARPGEVVVWDLARAPRDEEPEADVRGAMRIRRLEQGGVYSALVTAVADRSAAVDLGNATGTIPLAATTWARRFNPTSATREPRRMQDVLKEGDLVLVRVESAEPAKLAAEKKPLAVSLEQNPQVQGALVAIDPATRGVRALVGGFDFQASQFNRAFQAKRQPGSAFKPFVWGAAIESRRFTAATLVYDTPDVYRDASTGKDWKPQNFERDAYDGPMLLGAALAHSKNTVAVKLVDALGVDTVGSFAKRMGVESALPRQLSLALGTGEITPLELVNAYATIAARGFPASPILVRKVTDREGHVLEEQADAAPPPVAAESLPVTVVSLGEPDAEARPAQPEDGAAPGTAATIPETGCDPGVAWVLTRMMQEVVESGTGQGAKALGRPVAAKTGTAQEHRDAWFVGFTPELVAGVWIGFDSHEPLGPRETGGAAALPAWLSFMRGALAKVPARDFTAPAGVEVARIDPRTGLLAEDGAVDAPPLPFLGGTAPTAHSVEVDATPRSFFDQ